MLNLREKLRGKQDGFIAIVALGIFALLGIFGVIIQATTMETVKSVKSTNNYYAARDIADSTIEFLQNELNNHESGYSTDNGDGKNEIICAPNEVAVDPRQEQGDAGGVDEENPNLPNNPRPTNNDNSICESINSYIAERKIYEGKDIQVTVEIKGRSNDDENLVGNCPGIGAGGCYLVPFPGTGSAGNRCDLYTFDPSDPDRAALSRTDSSVNSRGEVVAQGGNAEDQISQIDYSCNWNKLTFGSSQTDRAAIPLYYDDGVNVVSVFNPDDLNNGDPATRFVLRVRTPCLPCAYGEDFESLSPEDEAAINRGKKRFCTNGTDPTICSADERWELNEDDGNDIVVQWQISGKCDPDGNGEYDEECGLIQRVDEIIVESSAITETIINESIGAGNAIYRVLRSQDEATNTSGYGESIIIDSVENMKLPVLSLFLSERLLSTNNINVPYLEYQFLTDKPVGDSKAAMNVVVNIDGNIFEKTVYKEEQKDLIDFAIQN